jgi:hypothetical protein
MAAKAEDRPSAIAIRALGIEVKFDVLASTMDEREQRLVQKLTTLQRSQAKRLVAIGNKAVKAGDATVLESTVIETAREAEELLAEMGGAFDDAAEEYMRQIVSQGAKALKPVDKADRVALLAIVAAEYGRELGDRMRTAWGGEVARQLRTGADPGRLAGMTTGAPEKLLTALAGMALGAGMGEGRAATAEANKAIIEREIYTTMMDSDVCEVCDQYENEEYPVGEGPDAPNPDCLGTVDRCRCWRVPVIVRE